MKDGTEINTMTMVDMTWSVNLFFFNAAKVPKSKPSGIEIRIDKKLTYIVNGNFCIIISVTDCKKYILNPTPQLNWVNIFLRKIPY